MQLIPPSPTYTRIWEVGKTLDGRTPRPGYPRRSASTAPPPTRGLRRSTRLGILYYLAHTRNISDQQKAYLMHLQGKSQLQELTRARQVFSDLKSDPRVRARLQVERYHIPVLPQPHKPKEKRRIGIGYQDKGSLRPQHRPTKPGEVTVGSSEEAILQQHFSWTPRTLEAGIRSTSDEIGLQFARSLTAPRRHALLRGQSYPEGGYPLTPEGSIQPYWEEPPPPTEGERIRRLHQLLEREGISRDSWELLESILPAHRPEQEPELQPSEQSLLPLVRRNWLKRGGTLRARPPP